MESHTVPSEPTVRIDALETFVELLSRVEADPSSDAFYSRLCEATCRLADMDRAVIFRYDGARRRVRAAGSFGIPLDVFADAQVTVETVPVARESLLEDRVIEISSAMAEGVPDEFKDLIRESTLVCTPMAAAGRWLGVILSDRGPDRPPLRDSERYLLWTLGKTAALAAFARLATNKQAQARQLQERMDLAREVHESVIQRLFGIQLVFSSHGRAQPRGPRAHRRRAAGRARRPAPRAPAPARPQRARDADDAAGGGRAAAHASTATCTSRCATAPSRSASRTSSSRWPSPCWPRPSATPTSTPGRARSRSRLEVKDGDTLVLDVINDGVRSKARQHGMGLKLAALEALQLGGIVEFGEREPGTWRVRLAVPLDRT